MFKEAFKDFFKKRVLIEVLSGFHTIKDKPSPVRFFTVMKGNHPSEVIINVPHEGDKTFTLTGVEWEESHKRSGGKAAASAIAGTLIAGPLGTIAGAAIGGKRKDTSKAFLFLKDDQGNEHQLHIRCNTEKYIDLSSFLD